MLQSTRPRYCRRCARPEWSGGALRVLVYDGDCPLCVWIARRFEGLGLTSGSAAKAYQVFEGEEARRLEVAGIRNEMLVLDSLSGELRTGIDGFLWLVEDSRWRWSLPILSLAPLRWSMRHVYRTIAYNRRLIAPPRRGVVCACEPDPHPGYRVLFFVMIAVALAGLWLLVSTIIGWLG